MARIYRDALGVPHVRATSIDDLAHGQGLVTARDRAWQLEFLRRRATGTTAEAFGPSLVSADMNSLCNGAGGELSGPDVAVAEALEARGVAGGFLRDGRARRFFWGLALEPEWRHALPLAEAVLRAFSEPRGWAAWRAERMGELGNQEPLHSLLERQRRREAS